MQTYQATLHYTLVRTGDADPLTHPPRFIEYMTGAFEDCGQVESLWLISMNPKQRPIARTLVRTGPLVAAMTSPRELFRVALHADADAIAVVRGEPTERIEFTVHDHQAVKRFGETARCLSIQFADYLVVSTNDALSKPLFYSWRATTPPLNGAKHESGSLEFARQSWRATAEANLRSSSPTRRRTGALFSCPQGLTERPCPAQDCLPPVA